MCVSYYNVNFTIFNFSATSTVSKRFFLKHILVTPSHLVHVGGLVSSDNNSCVCKHFTALDSDSINL